MNRPNWGFDQPYHVNQLVGALDAAANLAMSLEGPPTVVWTPAVDAPPPYRVAFFNSGIDYITELQFAVSTLEQRVHVIESLVSVQAAALKALQTKIDAQHESLRKLLL